MSLVQDRMLRQSANVLVTWEEVQHKRLRLKKRYVIGYIRHDPKLVKSISMYV